MSRNDEKIVRGNILAYHLSRTIRNYHSNTCILFSKIYRTNENKLQSLGSVLLHEFDIYMIQDEEFNSYIIALSLLLYRKKMPKLITLIRANYKIFAVFFSKYPLLHLNLSMNDSPPIVNIAEKLTRRYYWEGNVSLSDL